ncbi:MAG: hypothetical protein M1821_003169 [Bathelium mastoideum]|nr:MAG: hypothetical protein M1821_003169 [Bathelium mastoideum]
MPLDPLSPIAPARVRVLLLPVGRIRKSRFQSFVARLEPQFLVRLGDISPDGRPDRNMFSPAAFPNGMVIYDFSTHLPSSSHLALSPFELFREPLMILGLADGSEYASLNPNEVGDDQAREQVDEKQDGSFSMDNLFREVDLLREQYPKVLAHKLLIFDNKPVSSVPPLMPDDVIFVPPITQLRTTTMKTIMCDATATFLAELTSYARSIQALSTIDSPSNAEGSHLRWANQSSSNVSIENAKARPASRILPSETINKRMSMPVQLRPSSSDRPGSQTASRPSTPQEGTRGRRAPEYEFGTSHGRTDGEISISGPTARSEATSEARDSSRDSMSIQGFGSGSLSERNRNRGKGRIGIVIGTLYLIAGRWNDALKELVESTNRARAFSDHIWYAKGVENILISSVVSPYAEKAPPPKPAAHTTTAGTLDAPKPNQPSNESARAALVKLSELLPDSLNMIMSIYDRAAANVTEALPDNAFSEAVIRISKLFATLHVFGGTLTYDALEALICCKPLESFAPNPSSRLFIRPLRQDIAELSFKALPPRDTKMVTGDRIIALAGIASVLSMLGLQRKKAIIIKELLTVSIPSLIDARKAGAAEIGIHPAAGLSALSLVGSPDSGGKTSANPSEHGFKELMVAAGQVYGINLLQLLEGPQSGVEELKVNGLNPADNLEQNGASADDGAPASIASEAITRFFGSLHLKYDILRTGLAFCEALPDFDGVLQLSATMLKTAGPAVVPGLNESIFGVTLAKEEQVRLATNIPRTLGAARTLGLTSLEVDYWDDFLVSDVYFEEASPAHRPIYHPKSELDVEADRQSSKSSGPFIYDASSKATAAGTVEKVLVSGEPSRFDLILRNPFEFEVEIEWLKLAVEHLELESLEEHLILGPFRTQTIPIKAIALQAGELRIIGCLIKVRGCREKKFNIYNKPWVPESETRVKNTGLLAAKASNDHTASQDLSPKDKETTNSPGPDPSHLVLTVIREQPLLQIQSISLTQSSVMILEGERQMFRVTLKNVASNSSVDLLLVSFQDSTIAPIQAALKNKDLPRPELYELELQYLRNQAFQLRNSEQLNNVSIGPGEIVEFEFEVLGKPGLSEGAIQIDYACLGMPRAEIKERFFTRRVSIPLSITVNASVMFQRLDVVPFPSDFAWSNQQRHIAVSPKTPTNRSPNPDPQKNRFSTLLDRVGREGSASEHCLVLLDLRNAWPNPITISIDVLHPSSSESGAIPSSASSENLTRVYTIHEYLYPGHTTRTLLLLPRLYLPNLYAPIPILDEKNKRQFVRSQGQLSPEAERDTREKFWYREEFLKHVKGRWKEESGMGGSGREGELDLRGIRLSRGMLDSLKLDDIAIEMSIHAPGDDETTTTDQVVKRLGRSRFELRVDEFVVLKATLRNRSAVPVQPVLRLLPALVDQPAGAALDLDRKLAWTGLLQRVLPPLAAGADCQVELGLCALCSGEFEIGASVEELQVLKDDGLVTGGGKGQGRARSGTDSFNEDLIRDRSRRVWYASQPCRIIAIGEH